MDPQTEEQVAELLGSLKRVNAPENFESRVKSRLAVSPAPAGNFGFLKLALPTAALAAIALFLFLSGYLGGEVPTVEVANAPKESRSVPQVQSVPSQMPSVNVDSAQQQPPSGAQTVVAPENSNVQQPVNYQRKNPNGSRPIDPSRQSYDIGSNTKETVVLPPGFDPNSRPRPDANMEKRMRRPTIAATDVLRLTGVNAEFRGHDCVDNSVVAQSAGERIGVKAGDVIISLNDIRIGNGTSLPSGVDLQSITVRRGGAALVLKFQSSIVRGIK
jgi:hypothetical protein